MVVWRITGDSIGQNSCGAAHFATKAEADKAIKEYVQVTRQSLQDSIDNLGTGETMRDDYPYVDGPFKLVVKNREQLASMLDDAMGFGGS